MQRVRDSVKDILKEGYRIEGLVFLIFILIYQIQFNQYYYEGIN